MSDLQISLVVVGVVVIGGVILFNKIQLARYHRRIQDGFRHDHDDVLLDTESVSVAVNERIKHDERIEPQFGDEVPVSIVDSESARSAEFDSAVIDQPLSGSQSIQKEQNVASETVDIDTDNTINYIASISSNSPIPHEKLIDLLQQKFDYGKPVRWYGLQSGQSAWEEISLDAVNSQSSYVQLKGGVQLADRSGLVTEINLSRFRDMVEDFSSQLGAEVECPDIVDAYTRAVDLDKFCADVDIIIGVNIISKDGGAFIGTKIRALAEASGFRLESEGVFKYRDSETDNVLFSLGNFESAPFLPGNMRTLTTHGITFLLDVPRVARGEKVFDQMIHIAKLFSSTLNGILVDDNRVPLSENGIRRSRQRLIDIQSEMAAYNIAAGSKTALKLFN